MKPAPFDYIAATSVEMAAASLADGGDDAKIIAGGQSLVPLLNFRLLRPSILIDINRIESLAFIRETATRHPRRRAHAAPSARDLAGDRAASAGSLLRDDACGASRDP